MKRQRREAIQSWRDFPIAYSDMVRSFAGTHHLALGAMDHASAIATRNHFYRFRRWLALAPPDDIDGQDLCNIAQYMQCRLIPDGDRYILEWFLSPIGDWALSPENPINRSPP